VNPIDYLTDVLDRIEHTADGHFHDLRPHRWKPPAAPGASADF
jgi:hypothetical protein